jgi:hypothetical protein
MAGRDFSLKENARMKWVLIYWIINMNLGFTGQAYFDTKELCQQAHETITRGAIRAVCLQAMP